MCSVHFVDSKPTVQHPDPTLHLGYALPLSTHTARRSRLKETSQTDQNPVCEVPEPQVTDEGTVLDQPVPELVCENIPSAHRNKSELNNLKGRYFAMSLRLKHKTKLLSSLTAPLHKRLLTNDSKCSFYTGISLLTIFNALCAYTKELKAKVEKSNKGTKDKRRPAPKLYHEDAILLTLMKLRLALLHRDLADRSVSHNLFS